MAAETATVLYLQSHSFSSLKCYVHLNDWKWKKIVLKNIQFSLWFQKESSSNRWKVVWRIRCKPTVEPKKTHITLGYYYPQIYHVHVHFTSILDRYGKYRTLAVFTWTFEEFWQWNSTCATIILLDIHKTSVDLALLARVAAWLGNFLRCFILLPTILPQNKISYIILHFWGPI